MPASSFSLTFILHLLFNRNLHPIQVCLALQVYLKVNQLTEIVIDQSDLLNKALFNVFQSCANVITYVFHLNDAFF